MPTRRELPPGVWKAMQAKIAAEEERRARYGDVRPIISTVYQDHRFVAVGSTLHWNKSEKWRTFHDFLSYFIQRVFGQEWGANELKKPAGERHIIFDWADALTQLKARHPEADERGICSAVPDGPSFAYLLLAYDLYLLGDHGKLRDRFVERLKRRDEFQSARYELFAAAAMIRAGFDIELENERDLSRQHGEYVATHRVTNEAFAVEAKSRRVPGVLGFLGDPIPAEDFHLDIRQLVRRALEKRIDHPYIIFLDANMPPSYAENRKDEWSGNVNQALHLADSAFNDVGIRVGSLFNFMAVTNVPDHYGEIGGVAPEPVFYSVRPAEIRRLVKGTRVYDDIERSLSQCQSVPGDFPPSD